MEVDVREAKASELPQFTLGLDDPALLPSVASVRGKPVLDARVEDRAVRFRDREISISETASSQQLIEL